MKNGVEVPRHMIVNRGEDSDHTDGEYSSSSNKERRENEKGRGGRERGGEERKVTTQMVTKSYTTGYEASDASCFKYWGGRAVFAGTTCTLI